MSRIKQVYLIALLVITTTSMVSVSRASTTSIPGPLTGGNAASGVISNIAHQEKLLLNSIHSQRAISLAINSLDFQTKIASTHYYFNSIYYEFSWLPNSANPVVTMNTVNVVYSHENSNGTTTNIVATEDSSLASVRKVTVESVVPRNGCVISGGHCQASSNWDGYEFFNHVGTTYNPIYEVRASWTVPQAYVPILSTSGKNCNWPTHCDLSTWVGLSNTAGGGCANGGCIVQGGTESGQQCGVSGCGPNNGGYYYPWYEFLPAASVACGGTGGSNIHYGDSYTEYIYNDYQTLHYNIIGYDLTAGYGCEGQADYNNFACPNNQGFSCIYYGQFISETPLFGTTVATLPAFTQITTGSTCYIDDSSIYGAYASCYGASTLGGHWDVNEYHMPCPGYQDMISHTAPSSGSNTYSTQYNNSC